MVFGIFQRFGYPKLKTSECPSQTGSGINKTGKDLYKKPPSYESDRIKLIGEFFLFLIRN